MHLLVTTDLKTILRFDMTHLGHLMVPTQQSRIEDRLPTGPVAGDNRMFHGITPEREREYRTMLRYIVSRGAARGGARKLIEWVAAPDRLKNAKETRRLWGIWQPVLHDYGIPAAYVLQDGSEKVPTPDNADALFIGGGDAFKHSPYAHREIQAARARGWPVHLGRCNSRARFEYAYNAGCTSVDASIFGKHPDKNIPRAVKILARLHRERPTLDMPQTDLMGWA